MADQIEILIKTTAELAGAKAAADSLERQIGQAKILGKSLDEINEKQKQLNFARSNIKAYETNVGTPLAAQKAEAAAMEAKALAAQKAADIEKNAGAFPVLGGMLGAIKGMSWGAIAAGVTGLATAFKTVTGAISEFAKEEVVLVKLDTALKNAGQSTSEYKERLAEMAQEMSKATAIDDTQWMDVFTRLTQFGADSSNIGAASEAVKNLSGLLGGDLQTSAMLVSKALQGNFAMFGRYGISVKDAGTQTEKLNELFKILAERGGGQMEAMAETLTGKWAAFTIAFDDSLKAVGRFIGNSGALQKSLELLTFVFNGLEDAIGKPIRKLPELSDLADKNKVAMTDAAGGADKYAKAVEAISKNASTALEAMKKLSEEENKDKSHADKMADLQKQFELGKVDIMGKSGALTPLGVIAAKAAIEQRFADAKAKRDQDAAAAEGARAEKALKDTEAQIQKDIQRSEILERQAVIAANIKRMQTVKASADEMVANGGQLSPYAQAYQEYLKKGGRKDGDVSYGLWRDSLSEEEQNNTPATREEFLDASGRSAEVAKLYSTRLGQRISSEMSRLGGLTPDQVIAANEEDAATAATRMGIYTKSKTGMVDSINGSWRRYRESRDIQTGETANRGQAFMGATMDNTFQQGTQARYELNRMGLNIVGTLREFTDAMRLYNETMETARRQIKNGGGNR